MHGLMNVK